MSEEVETARRELAYAIFNEWRGRHFWHLYEACRETIGHAGSPIEELLAITMAFTPMGLHPGDLPLMGSPCSAEVAVARVGQDTIASTHVYINPQVQIEDIRVDFLITYKNSEKQVLRLAVECDGHDFHERTKEQAARDRTRDRRLQSMGYVIYRFTGSEIFASPQRCVAELAKIIADFEFGRR